MESKLLDMRDCFDKKYQEIYRDLLQLQLERQPRWFWPLLLKSALLKGWIGYDHWSRAWEYPWAIQSADLNRESLRILDVGGGGSPFAEYLAKQGHECFVVDPSLNKGVNSVVNAEKSIYRNLRSFVFFYILKFCGINRLWGLPIKQNKYAIHYYPHSAAETKFSGNYFDRVFCLSVLEHIPLELWPRCVKEFERVLKPNGMLIITLDMSTFHANSRQYLELVNSCALKLVGDLNYDVPISMDDKKLRHPGYTHETVGLVWQA